MNAKVSAVGRSRVAVGLQPLVLPNAVNKSNETKRYVADATNGGSFKKLAEDNAAVNAELLDRLGAVEHRLASIEKTLTDVP